MEIVSDVTNIRLDVYLASVLDENRTKIQKLNKEGKILVNDKVCKSNYTVKVGDVIVVSEIEKEDANIKPYDFDLDIVFEDEYLLVINKPSSLVVHPGSGHEEDTLVNALVNYSDCFDSFDSNRPGIVHRIDKDTSGLLVVAKNYKVMELLGEMIKNREITRKYLALVKGTILHETGTIDAPIGRDMNNRKKMAITSVNSKEAITHFKVIDRLNDATLVECKLDTGRTHQIRVHMEYIKHPIIGDPVYNNKKAKYPYGQMLHAYKLEFVHPITKENLSFTSETEEEFNKILEEFKN